MRESKLERDYQVSVLNKIRAMFPGCIILKNDEQYQQGIPDWTVLWVDRWAFLEIKRDISSAQQPNQEYFVDQASEMCFGAFICPENEEDVLYGIHGIQQAFRTRRKARLS